MSESSEDRQFLRRLAGRVRDIASLPEMDERRRLWLRHNALKSDRPMVLCFPEGAWDELLPDSDLQTHDPLHRWLERNLRSRIMQWELIHDDNIVEATIDVPWKVHIGDFGLAVPRHFGDNRGSFVWDPPLKDLERDFEKLHQRELSVDREATVVDFHRVQELVGDLLPVRIRSSMLWWTAGLTQDAAYLMGMEQMMWAMVDQPDSLHRLMAFLRDDFLHVATWCQGQNLLGGNDVGNDFVGSGGVGLVAGLGRTGPDAPVQLDQMWGFAESQETVGVSPAMFEEFVLPYQVPLLDRFALNCYGCCEGLERRIDSILQQVPRLRRVSFAPNANQEILAEKLAGKYIVSRKPYPAHVCVNFNEEAIRADLRHTLKVARGQPLEIILKDTHTIENQPERLKRWVEIAREEISQSIA